MRILTDKEKRPLLEGVQDEIESMINRTEHLLDLIAQEQRARYDQIASLNIQVNHHEKEIQRGADLARQLEQLSGILENAIGTEDEQKTQKK